MSQHQITGIGPIKPDGSRFIFTVRPQPFHVTEAWLAEQSKQPAVGDFIEMGDNGALTLVTEAKANDDAAEEETNEDGTQKKSLGLTDSAGGLENSHGRHNLVSAPFKTYHIIPVTVYAAEITKVRVHEDVQFACTLADGTVMITDDSVSGDEDPKIGDYWVEDTASKKSHLIPKAEFEATFALASE